MQHHAVTAALEVGAESNAAICYCCCSGRAWLVWPSAPLCHRGRRPGATTAETGAEGGGVRHGQQSVCWRSAGLFPRVSSSQSQVSRYLQSYIENGFGHAFIAKRRAETPRETIPTRATAVSVRVRKPWPPPPPADGLRRGGGGAGGARGASPPTHLEQRRSRNSYV